MNAGGGLTRALHTLTERMLDAQTKWEEKKAALTAGTFAPFTGPIKDQTGAVKYAAGVRAPACAPAGPPSPPGYRPRPRDATPSACSAPPLRLPFDRWTRPSREFQNRWIADPRIPHSKRSLLHRLAKKRQLALRQI